jgi:1,4-dihydroxy-6-naphthoate synthase
LDGGRLTIAHSIDLDDAFMFWAIATGRIDAGAYGFEGADFRTADTETLNGWAGAGEADVVAVSIAHVPAIAREYLLLPHGGSLGRGRGPIVIAAASRTAETLAGRRVGIPGQRTTAARLLAEALPAAVPVVVPFLGAFDAIDSGDVDAAVLIHEGRLIYERRGYHRVLDLGEWWAARTGALPLPLGGNVIRRALEPERIGRASAWLRESIAHALAHRDQALDDLLRTRPGMPRAEADAYLRLYANADTLDYGPDGRSAVERLVGAPVEWAP